MTPALEVPMTGERVTLAVPVAPPCARGSVRVGLATARTGPAVHPTLERTLVWNRGERIPDLTLFVKDVRALFPRGARVWLVVRYGDQAIAAHPVELRA